VKRLLIAAAAMAGVAACINNPCQTSITPLSYGSCTTAADAGFYTGPSSAQRNACELGCISSSDQTAIGTLFSCINNIPAAVGTCTVATEGAWVANVGTQAEACVNAAATQLSLVCKGTIALGSVPDAG